ncbi:MAG: peptidoglycan recognition protein family protein [Phycisphaerales bacterium]
MHDTEQAASIHSTARTRPALSLLRGLTRTQVVWLALLASMTAVGGVLLAIDTPRSGSARSIALAAATPTVETPEIGAIFDRLAAALDQNRWQRIVIHHSAEPFGSAETIAADHTSRGLQGLGYHFVIGNGQGAGDGELFVGRRWIEQLPGAHVAGPQAPWNNQHAIGICLVGDGDRRSFTPAQLARLRELIDALAARLDIPETQVVLHRDLAPTSSPGRLFPEAALRAGLAQAQ